VAQVYADINGFIIIYAAAAMWPGGEYVNEYDPMTVGLLTSYFSTGLARRGLTQTELLHVHEHVYRATLELTKEHLCAAAGTRQKDAA